MVNREVVVMNRNGSNRIWMQVVAFVAILAVTAQAGAGTYPPEWRGNSGTTFQQWSFSSSGRVNVQPDAAGLNNQYGDPFVWVGDRAVWNDSGAWAMITDEMDIFIPNNPQLQDQKQMQIEIVWSQGGQGFLPKRPLLSVYPQYEDSSKIVFPDISILDQQAVAGTNLVKTLFGVDIEPNPMNEWIVIKGDIVIDHLAVDTYCIPEPATLGLLIGGAFMAIRRKQKTQ